MSWPDNKRLDIMRNNVAPMVSEFYPEFANKIWGV